MIYVSILWYDARSICDGVPNACRRLPLPFVFLYPLHPFHPFTSPLRHPSSSLSGHRPRSGWTRRVCQTPRLLVSEDVKVRSHDADAHFLDQDKTLGQTALTGQEERQVPDQVDQVLGSLSRLWLEQLQSKVVVNCGDHRRRRPGGSIKWQQRTP